MDIHKIDRSRYWQCRDWIHGKEVRFSCRTEDRAEAEVFALQERARRLVNSKELARPVGSLLEAAVADSARADAEGVTARHILVLESRWKQILTYFGPDTPAASVTQVRFDKYIADRCKKVKRQTVRREAVDLVRGLNLLASRGLLDRASIPVKPRMKSDAPNEARASKIHPIEIVSKVLQIVPTEMRDAALVVMATGVRYAELRRIDDTMLKTDGEQWWFDLPPEVTKTRKGRVIGVREELIPLLQSRGEGVLFPRSNYAKAFGLACKEIGYDKTVTLRDLRATFASDSVNSSADIVATMGAMGHSNVRTTERYLKTTKARVLALAAKLPPLPGLPPLTKEDRSSSDRSSKPQSPFKLSGWVASSASLEGCYSTAELFPHRDISALSGRLCTELSRRNPAEPEHAPEQVRTTPRAVISGTYPLVKVYCANCDSEHDQEQAPTYECLFCDSKTVVSLVDPEDVVEVTHAAVGSGASGIPGVASVVRREG